MATLCISTFPQFHISTIPQSLRPVAAAPREKRPPRLCGAAVSPGASNMKSIAKTITALFALAAIPALAEDAYVESDGTTFVNTGVFPGTDLRIEVDYALTAVETDVRIFGVYVSGGQNAAYYVNTSGGLSFHVGAGWVGGSYLVMPDLNRHTVVFDVPAGKVHSLTGSVTNKTVSMNSTPGLSGTGTVPIALFGRMTNANGATIDNPAKARIYSAKFYRNGTPVCNLVPCVTEIPNRGGRRSGGRPIWNHLSPFPARMAGKRPRRGKTPPFPRAEAGGGAWTRHGGPGPSRCPVIPWRRASGAPARARPAPRRRSRPGAARPEAHPPSRSARSAGTWRPAASGTRRGAAARACTRWS